MTRRLVILYEDSRGPFQRFPLHDLVVKSAADLVRLDVHEILRRVAAVPKNGVTKVLDDVGSGRFTQPGEHLLVWVDNDRIRRCASTCAALCARGGDRGDQSTRSREQRWVAPEASGSLSPRR